MKHKTLCRLAVRLIGLVFLINGLLEVPAIIAVLAHARPAAVGVPLDWAMFVGLIEPIGSILIGVYLFLGGTAVVNYLIPSNRPYCHECGYELTLPASKHCPECGTEHNRPTPTA